MSIPTIFDLCFPRPDVIAGTSSDADFAADLSHVVRGTGGPAEYANPELFFANTYPTRGLKSLLAEVCTRLSGLPGAVGAIFRLDTSFGGGKTHGLIALVHAAGGMKGVEHPEEFIHRALLPSGPVRVAVFDGENADPANGRRMGDGVLAFTPWGELAYALAGPAGYERVRKSDIEGVAPGAETIAELFGGQPTLILLDELSIYLRKIQNRPPARNQLTAFLTSLFKAVESSPRAALVYTLAIGKDGRANDAYGQENRFISDSMAEAESVSARKATLLNPTEDDETVQVLRRRLFGRIDDVAASTVIEAYRRIWADNRPVLPADAMRAVTGEAFRVSYPLHPDIINVFTEKTATIENFQRVRGMLRILGRTIARLWATRPGDATAIHLHHIDPGFEPIRQEIVTRLGQSAYVPALKSDIAGDSGKASLAVEIDAVDFNGLPPYTTYAARTIFVHTLAGLDKLKGLSPEQMRYSMVGPNLDISFIDSARQKFIARSAYLDDRPGSPLRFLADANLTQVIRREEANTDPAEVRAQLRDIIKKVFEGATLEPVYFPGGPWDVPDEIGNNRPLLIVLSYDAVSVGASVETVPDLVARIYERKGAEGGSLRGLRNNLCFIAAEDLRIDDMRQKMARRLALGEMKKPDRLMELADHQQAKVRELEARSETEVAIAVQQCFRHLFYPSRTRIPGASVDLAHTAFDIHSTSEAPGAGQRQVVRALRDLRRLRIAEDDPDSPLAVRDRTPLRRGQITTSALRDEFRKDVALPMLVGDDVFVKGIRKGVDQGEFVYRRGELLYGPGDPQPQILIDEQAVVFTMAYAKEHGVWPRPQPQPSTGGGTGDPPWSIPGTTGVQGGTGQRAVAEPMRGTGTWTIADPDKLPPPDPDGPPSFSAEGVLREALIRLWEQARAARVELIDLLTIRMFDPTDAFRVLNVVASIRGASEKMVLLDGGYETTSGSSFQFEYRGTPADAQPVKDFLDPQLRAAKEKTVKARFEIRFAEGLTMTDNAAETLTEQLSRFATGAAYVEATAVAKP